MNDTNPFYSSGMTARLRFFSSTDASALGFACALSTGRFQITNEPSLLVYSPEKTNYAPPGHGGWFRPASVELANGDCVGVVEPWRHPDE
jgi:hypothetical protein